MIGNIILWVKNFTKQQFCIHEYKIQQKGEYDWLECEKCGKTSNNYDLLK